MKPTCLVIDDEPLARKGLAEDVTAIGLVTVSGTAANPAEAIVQLAAQPIDLLFLDIEFNAGNSAGLGPRTNGLEFLRGLPVKPLVILVTAYPQYALDGYEHGVVDYLVKPVPLLRLRTACEQAVKQHLLRGASEQAHLFLKCNGVYERIDIADILFVEAANNYIQVHTAKKKLLIYHSLKGIEEQLPPGDFIQVHKSFVVAKRYIRRIDGSNIVVAATRIPLSRRFKAGVLASLHLTNNSRPLG